MKHVIMSFFHGINSKKANNLNLLSKEQLLPIVLISTIIPALLYFYGASAFGIKDDSNKYVNSYFWIIVSYLLCNILYFYNYKTYLDFIIRVSNNKEYNVFINNLKKSSNGPLKFRWQMLLFFTIMPLAGIIHTITIKKDFVPGSSLMFMLAFPLLIGFLLNFRQIDICQLVDSGLVKYKFKYTDKFSGNKHLVFFLNSNLTLAVCFLFFGILLAYTIYNYSENIYGDKYLIYLVYWGTSFCYILYGSFWLVMSILTYHKFYKKYYEAKIRFLLELEKKDTLESLLVYNYISSKPMWSVTDKILQPIKILISPTLMAFTRSKVITVEDLNSLYNWFLS